jgi:radical SAM superfamily enzyme YgiQ (UPF0313 family)
MKILLLLPWEKEYKAYRDRFSAMLTYAPITLVTLAALIPQELKAEVDICDEMTQKFDYDKHYDIVAISFVTPSSHRAYEIAQKFQAKGAHVVFGGYHTTFLPEEAAKYADTIIVGAADKAFPQFLRDFANGRPEKQYENADISPADYKIPRRDLLPKHGYLNVPCVIANRGCPNRCGFCAISAMNPPCPRPVADVINEIKSLNSKRLLFFDPNFFQNRQYALELMSELEKLKIHWGSNSTVAAAFDDELVKAAQKSGCIGVLFGLESMSKVSLQGAGKGFNDPEKYKHAIDIMHEHDISVNACFVLGFDYDTKESLLSFPEQAEYLGVNIVRYAILTPVPKTKLYKRLESEGRILTNDWTKYTQNKAVFQPKNMSAQELEEIYVKVWKDSYKMRKIWGRVKNVSSLENKALIFGANLGFKYVGSNVERS